MSSASDINITEALENKIDRSKWVSWKFSDLVANIVEKVIPRDSGLEHYIGLEHLDSGSLKIRRFGETSSLIGDKLKIYKGDLIFAKRNAYLKRVAIAEFDAVASAHSMVLRSKEENVLPEFLPFFLLSETFWQRAIEISVGSLSPTINWKVLAKQEFLLPPKDQQAKLAELLWAMDELIERERTLNLKIDFQSKVYLAKAFRHGAFLNQQSKESPYGPIPRNWDLRKLEELGDFKNGINKDKDAFGYGKPFVNLLDLFGFKELYKKEFELVNVTEKEVNQFDIKKGDVMFIRSSVKPSGVGLTTLIQEDLNNTVYSGFIIRFRPKSDELTHIYKKYCFYEERFRYSLIRRSTVSANTNINQESLNKLLIPVPPPNEQEEFNRVMKQFEDLFNLSVHKIESSLSLQKSLINQIF